ncbi:hypothetical protein FB451DRAFT_1274899 [Mycena latifolia]|nr:hypothetical protein FB451DRAFT_1274899 [Mycena latifolia]
MFSFDSPFADKLDTNYVPSDFELDQLRALLAEPMDELARIDAQIDEMKIAIRQLKTMRASLNAEIEAHRALISPMRRVPQDILLEIFFACLPTTHNALIDPLEAPMLFGRICASWRSVAYSTPNLWSSLHIPALPSSNWLSTVPADLEDELAKVVETWLDRSATCPLSVSLCRGRDDIDAPGSLNQLIRVSGRIRRLRIWGFIKDVRPLVFMPAADFPSLESIDIQCPPDSDQLLTFWDTVSVFHAPNLHRITLDISTEPLTLPIPWSQITDLNLTCFPIWSDTPGGDPGGLNQNGAQTLLRRCPNLVRCFLRVTQAIPFVAGPTITLPHLEALVLLNRVDTVEFMQTLIVPKLVHLGVGEERSPALAMVESPTQGLTLDLLYGWQLSEDGLLNLLKLFPAISDIRAMRFDVEDDFLARLSPSPTTVCPGLKNVDFGICYFSDAALLDFIRARMISAHPLERVTARLQRAMTVDIVGELQAFISQGLQLDLQYLSNPDSVWKFNPREGIYDDEVDIY